MADRNTAILVIFYHHFKPYLKTTEAAWIIQEEKGNELSECTFQNRFNHFKQEYFSLEIKRKFDYQSLIMII